MMQLAKEIQNMTRWQIKKLCVECSSSTNGIVTHNHYSVKKISIGDCFEEAEKRYDTGRGLEKKTFLFS
jgi:hypothetical protein